MSDRYVLVTWPEIQDYMDNPRYKPECFSGQSMDENNTEGVWFVPEDLYEEVEVNKLYPAELILQN
nr:MAG TPA: hypothetical protein [Bacteriophage sp.]